MAKKLLWPAVVLVFTLISVSLAAQGPEELIFQTKMGEVSFAHKAHLQKIECATCHHTGENFSCSTCHGQDADIPRLTDALHMQCKGCHKESGLPTGCRDCHKK